MYMSKNIKENYISKYNQVFNQANAQVELALKDIVYLSSSLNTNAELVGAINLATGSDSTADRLKNEQYIQNILLSSTSSNFKIENIVIYISGHSFMMYDGLKVSYSRIQDEDWFDDILSGNKKRVIICNYKLNRSIGKNAPNPYYTDVCIFAVPFNDVLTRKLPGVLLISIKSSYLTDILDQIENSYGNRIAMLDDQNNIIYASSDENMNFFKNTNLNYDSYRSGDTIYIDGNNYLFIKCENQLTNWKLVALIKNEVLYHDLKLTQYKILSLSLLILLIGITLSALFSRKITYPFTNLMKSMASAGDGNMILNKDTSSIKEIHQLIDQYNIMLNKISNLIKQIKSIEKEKRIAEINALQSQINPHFTYNTLDSIRWAALIQNAPGVADMISSFVKLLRATTYNTDEFVTVDWEIKQLSYYIEIMKFRSNCRIEVIWHIDDNILQCKTLKLILQPIVENCYIHGFQNFEKTGTIEISAYAENNKLYFVVKDDGIGTELDSQGKPVCHQNETSFRLHKKIGVKNVDDRIKLWFGPEYGIYFSSKINEGTTVSIVQPLQL